MFEVSRFQDGHLMDGHVETYSFLLGKCSSFSYSSFQKMLTRISSVSAQKLVACVNNHVDA